LKTPLHSILLVFVATFIGSFGAVFLKSGANRLELTLSSLIVNWRLLAGITLFLLSSVFFVAGLREGELTVLYPMASLGYIWTMLWSRYLFGERFSKTKLAGLSLILAGVCLIGLGNR
jgi:drug/metabolite transporter (DMT)-like permease